MAVKYNTLPNRVLLRLTKRRNPACVLQPPAVEAGDLLSRAICLIFEPYYLESWV
jgi:hypothetical protein